MKNFIYKSGSCFIIILILLFFTNCASENRKKSPMEKDFSYFLNEKLNGPVKKIEYGAVKHNRNFNDPIIIARYKKYTRENNRDLRKTVLYSKIKSKYGNYSQKLITGYDHGGNSTLQELHSNNRLDYRIIIKRENKYDSKTRVIESQVYNNGKAYERFVYTYMKNGYKEVHYKNNKKISTKVEELFKEKDREKKIVRVYNKENKETYSYIKVTDKNKKKLKETESIMGKQTYNKIYKYNQSGQIIKLITFTDKVKKTIEYDYSKNRVTELIFLDNKLVEKVTRVKKDKKEIVTINKHNSKDISKTCTIYDNYNNWILILSDGGSGEYRDIEYYR